MRQVFGGPHGSRLIAFGLLCVTLPGCWVEIYESRLRNTQDLYKRYEVRNRLLAKDYWSDNGGIRLRYPLEFEPLPPPPAPEPVKTEVPAGEQPPEPPPVKDDRQPAHIKEFLPILLPGLRGAFKSEKAYLYVVSNHGVRKPEGGADLVPLPGHDPLRFNSDIYKIFVESLADVANADYAKDCKPTTKPTGQVKFVKQVPFKTVNFNYPVRMSNGQEQKWFVSMYFYESGDSTENQVGLILIERDDGKGDSEQSIDMCLETLEVDPVQFKAEASKAGGAPAGKAGAF